MIKRFFDIIFSLIVLVIAAPVLLLAMLLVWLQDFHSPLYIATRVGKGMKPFRMVKLRSMVVDADQWGVDSTSANDRRITWIGRFIRKFKLDEMSQFWNVLWGHMSVVGPRPNVMRQGVALYTDEERHLLDVRPGITDFASIVFLDEGDILEGADDPDLLYDQIIRPYKSRLGLVYVRRNTFGIDVRLAVLTAVAIISKGRALRGVVKILKRLSADEMLIEVAKREKKLEPFPPPGAMEVVRSRELTGKEERTERS